MYASTLAAVISLQDAPGASTNRLLVIFIGIAAFALLAQAVVMLGIAIGVAKSQKAVMARIETMNSKLLPLLDKSTTLITDLTPQIKELTNRAQIISGHVEVISSVVREKVVEFGPTVTAANQTLYEANATVQDANRKTQAQVQRVNGMISSVLDVAAEMGRAIHAGIQTPVREVSNIVGGVKVGVSTFINGGRRQ